MTSRSVEFALPLQSLGCQRGVPWHWSWVRADLALRVRESGSAEASEMHHCVQASGTLLLPARWKPGRPPQRTPPWNALGRASVPAGGERIRIRPDLRRGRDPLPLLCIVRTRLLLYESASVPFVPSSDLPRRAPRPPFPLRLDRLRHPLGKAGPGAVFGSELCHLGESR